MEIDIGREWIDVAIDVVAHGGEELVAQRSWVEKLPR